MPVITLVSVRSITRATTLPLRRPPRISPRGQLLVHRDGLLEFVVFLARNEAEVFQFREHLLGLGGLAKHQISLAKMLAGAAVAGIKRQRLLVVANGRLSSPA